MIRTTTTALALLLAASATAFAAGSASTTAQLELRGFAPFAGKAQQMEIEKRSKRRVPGGSGCDSASDRVEHPQCR
jgi:hypothetical protein